MYILQTAFQVNPDSLAAKKAQITDVLLNTPPGELMHMLGQQAIQFGLKVLAALIIYGLGAWIISLIRKAVRRAFRRREAEPTVASFMDSLVSVVLWIILIVITISALGVNTTSIAALLAAGGMAIGMALGNIIGSNLFNILLILGGSALITPLSFLGMNYIDLGVLLLSALLLGSSLFIGRKNQVDRLDGAIFFLCWAAYMTYLILNL